MMTGGVMRGLMDAPGAWQAWPGSYMCVSLLCLTVAAE
jgi:hypothetical protein